MSTRATVHFQQDGKTVAIIYRHNDGYLEALGEDLKSFFVAVQEQTTDTCFNDPSYLAAKFVVWNAGEYSHGKNPLDFLSLGIILEDPGDIEYRYLLECKGNGPPKIKVEAVVRH